MSESRYLLLPSLILAAFPSLAAAQTQTRVDLNSAGQPANGTSQFADMSEDGRFVVITSFATNMGGSTAAGFADLFLRDRVLSTTVAITSSSTPPTEGMQLHVVPPYISRDGSVVGFTRSGGPFSTVPATAFIYERSSGTTTPLVLPGLVDVQIMGLDRTGTFAVILARTSVGAPQSAYRVHVPTGVVDLCSRSMTGAPVACVAADIDDEGKLVAFSTQAADVFPNDTAGSMDTFVLDIPGQIMMCASVDGSGIPAGGHLWRLSGNGRYVAFLRSDIGLVRDLRLQTTAVVSLTTENVQAYAMPWRRGAISPDGFMTAFISPYPTSDPDTSGSPDIHVRDSVMGTLLPVTNFTVYLLDVPEPLRFSVDGRLLLYAAVTTPTPSGGSQNYAIYVADYGPRCSSESYCSSLPNSTGAPATIGAQGHASRELNDLVITGVGLPNAANSLIFSGTSAIDPGTPFGNGLLCVGGAVIRHGVHIANGGVIAAAQDLSSAGYEGVNPGDTRYYQIVYRDPPAGGALFNTTNAVAVTFCW